MSRRDIVLKLIALDVAENGKLTAHGIRLYVENRVSWEAIQPSIQAGLSIWDAQHRAREETP